MTISVDLGPRLESFIEQLVEAGTYASRDALIRDAMDYDKLLFPGG